MNSEHFVKYVEYWKAHKKALVEHPETVFTKYNVKGEKNTLDTQFVSEMGFALEQAKVFEVDDDQKKLLSLTDAPMKNDEINLPFDTIFLDVSFSKKELEELGVVTKEAEEIVGIMIRKSELVSVKGCAFHTTPTNSKKCQNKGVGASMGTALRFSIMSLMGDEALWDTFSRNINLYPEDEGDLLTHEDNPVVDKKVAKFIHKFFLSFLNFLNNPEVEYVEHKRSDKNRERREKKGLPVIPSSFSIKIDGKLREYIDEMRRGEGWDYSHRFWVRGHFRDLTSPRYSEKKRIWILPYIKGKGVLIDKTYKVVKKEAV